MSAHVYQTNKFFIRLKKEHQETWQDLGEPKWMIQFGDDSFKNAMKYIRQKKFDDLNDNLLLKAYTSIKRIEYTAISIAIIIIILTILDVIIGG